jgi:hypothetical protein
MTVTARSTGLAALALALTACSPRQAPWVVLPATADTSGAALTIVGTVHYADLEGGVYTIRTDDGTSYDPTNLPAEFKKDGLAVEADARKQDSMAGIHQVGPIVTLTRIRNRQE